MKPSILWVLGGVEGREGRGREGKGGGSVPDSLGDYVEVVLGVLVFGGLRGLRVKDGGMGNSPLGLGVLRSCIGLLLWSG